MYITYRLHFVDKGRFYNMLNIALIGITLLALVGLSLLFHVLIKVTPEESWASAIMTILVLVYILGLLGNAGYALVAVSENQIIPFAHFFHLESL